MKWQLVLVSLMAVFLIHPVCPQPVEGKNVRTVINDTSYGARPDETGPIGGGRGYEKVVTSGDVTVETLDRLIRALENADAGDVIFLPGDTEIDCTVRVHVEDLVLKVPGGVTLASNRGQNGAQGAIIYSDSFDTRPLIQTTGPDVRITGLRIRGPDPKRRMKHHHRSFQEGRGKEYYYQFPVSDGIQSSHDRLTVDNCELSGWSHASIYLKNGKEHHVHHNYIHHNQYNGLGYGVSLDTAFARIEHNKFNFNRHSIAGTGRPKSGYEASNNVEMGTSLSHCFDMHGGRDRNDGTNIAGTRIRIHHNTFHAEKTPVKIRGAPQKKASVHHNWFSRKKPGNAVRSSGNTSVRNNAFGRTDPVVR